MELRKNGFADEENRCFLEVDSAVSFQFLRLASSNKRQSRALTSCV